jgi:hypothetical protein
VPWEWDLKQLLFSVLRGSYFICFLTFVVANRYLDLHTQEAFTMLVRFGCHLTRVFLMMHRIPQRRKNFNPFAHNAHVEVIRTSILKQKLAH